MMRSQEKGEGLFICEQDGGIIRSEGHYQAIPNAVIPRRYDRNRHHAEGNDRVAGLALE